MKGIVGNAKFMQHLVKFDLSGLTGVRFGATQINIQTNVSAKLRLVKVVASLTVIHTCIDIRWQTLHQFSAEKTHLLAFRPGF